MKITGYESVDIIRKEMGNRIRQIRIARNMTQKQCASGSGISVHTLSNLENGEDIGLTNFCLVLRELGLLANMDLLIPDESVQPLTVVRETGQRRRAGRTSQNSKNGTGAWKWGDEA